LPLRLLTGYTAPANLRSQEGTWYLGAWRVPAGLPDWARRSAWWAVDRWKLEPMARPALDSMRESLGLPEPRGSTFGDWMHAPDGGLALFPSWFCAPMRGWPALRFAGFPLFEPSDSRPSDPALEAFLSSDAPPIAFFPGSAGTGRSLLSLVHSAASDLGLRVLLLGGEAAGAADPSLYAAGDVVLSNVLPRTALFIHHGGIGSCAQGLAHRIPQLILPSAFDQFDNALRIEALGAGLWQRPSKADYTELIARALRLAPPERDLRVSTPSKPNDAVSLCCDYLDKQKSPEP
jgi:rhamnosyltransferase subunit B